VTPSPSWLRCKTNTATGSRRFPNGDALQAILELDLDEIAAIEPPRGFGRD